MRLGIVFEFIEIRLRFMGCSHDESLETVKVVSVARVIRESTRLKLAFYAYGFRIKISCRFRVFCPFVGLRVSTDSAAIR